MTQIPKNIANELKERVFKHADKVGYLSLSRPDSQVFLDKLVAEEDIGQIIAQFRGNERVRTYIKDAILNRYSKDKAREARPGDLSVIINQLFKFNAQAIEETDGIELFCAQNTSSSHYIIVANGTYIKWESALRKALIFSPGKPFAQEENVSVSIMLTLFCGGSRINNADKQHLKVALSACNAKPYFYGEGI